MSGFDDWLNAGGGTHKSSSGSDEIARDVLRVSYGDMSKEDFKDKYGIHVWEV